MKHIQIIWKGPVLEATGYGLASREYVLALDRQGFDIKIEGYSWGFPSIDMNRGKKARLKYLIRKPISQNKPKLLIYHTPAGNIKKVDEIKRFDHCILNTVWETTKIPNHWLPIIQQFDAVTVPCSQNIEAMVNSGVDVPLFLVPHGINTSEFHPKNQKLEVDSARGRFTFVSVFDFQHRKNPEALLKAYWEEFSSRDRVFMVIKTYGLSRHAILNSIQSYKIRLGHGRDTAPLLVLTGILNEHELKGIYTLGHAFVLPSRGEGVGLPFMEALASGIPVIATGWGGQMDFLNEKNSFLVNYQLSKPKISMNSMDAISRVYHELFDEEGQLWAEADVQDLRRKMRIAYENPGLCKVKGIQGRKDMLHFSWDHAGILFRQSIEKVIET